jgi:hypothetical protein
VAINPEHLFEQADKLASSVTGAPRQADLRRALSGIYYGLFHAVVADAADRVLSVAHRSSPHYELVYRSIDHKTIREVAEDLSKARPPTKYQRYLPAGGFGAEIRGFASTIVALQEKRHEADYNPLARIRRSDVLVGSREARAALQKYQMAGDDQRKAFLLLLPFRAR